MKIVAVRIGDRYGPEYEEYLESKLPEYEFIWIREPIRDDVKLQWNKMYGMSLDTDEAICVMDIDVLLENDYKKIFEYPVQPGQFVRCLRPLDGVSSEPPGRHAGFAFQSHGKPSGGEPGRCHFRMRIRPGSDRLGGAGRPAFLPAAEGKKGKPRNDSDGRYTSHGGLRSPGDGSRQQETGCADHRWNRRTAPGHDRNGYRNDRLFFGTG